MNVIIISAMWCGSCLSMKKIYKEIENELNIKFNYLDYDMDEEVKNYNIGDKIPVMIICDKDKELERIIGEKTKKEIINIINKYE